MRVRSVVIFLALIFVSCAASAESEWLKKISSAASSKMDAVTNTSLSDTKIGEGLKEALKVGIDNAIKATGKTDGYFANDLIRITMPQKLQMIDKPLRTLGLGKQIDEFILSMNRAAEKAAPSARDIFIDAITSVTMKDVRGLYSGGPSAATDFLKAKTFNKLKGQFAPVVTKALQDYDVTKKYQDIVGRYQQVPFAQKFPAPSIEDYVVGKSLDGLFKVLAQEEAKIRKDPAARTTDLLKEIFK
jgi:hypothetical protein